MPGAARSIRPQPTGCLLLRQNCESCYQHQISEHALQFLCLTLFLRTCLPLPPLVMKRILPQANMCVWGSRDRGVWDYFHKHCFLGGRMCRPASLESWISRLPPAVREGPPSSCCPLTSYVGQRQVTLDTPSPLTQPQACRTPQHHIGSGKLATARYGVLHDVGTDSKMDEQCPVFLLWSPLRLQALSSRSVCSASV